MLEFLLINHPLDCPMCDKGGECPLQNQAMADGRGVSRYDGVKRRFPKPIALSPMLLLDRERCVLCQRCTRFGDQISGDSLLSLVERGAKSQIGRGPSAGLTSYFTGNLAQICPVGALTTVDYRFQARPFDLASAITTCDNCAAGCLLRVDQRHGEVRRRLAASDESVNQEWNCDKGRFGFRSAADRLTQPMVRHDDGELHPATWPVALAVAAAGLHELGSSVGVLPGGRMTRENAVAYARFARALGSNSVDARTRRGATAEEAAFLGRQLAKPPAVSYEALRTATKVVLVAFEPEDECPMVYLALRRAVRKAGCKVVTIAPFTSPGSRKLQAQVVPTAPGDEVAALNHVPLDASTIVLIGERAGEVQGLLPSAESAANSTGARLAWVPRRAGEWSALAAGCLPSPGGFDAAGILAAAGRGEFGLVIGGVDPYGMANQPAMWSALEHAPFIVSLEQRPSDISWSADVVLPVALLAEQSGSFLSWTGQIRPVAPVVSTTPMTDRRVLQALASRLGIDLGVERLADATRLADEARAAWATGVIKPPAPSRGTVPAHSPGAARLATWRTLLVGSRSIDGAVTLSHRPPNVVTGPAIAAATGVADGQTIIVGGPDGTRLAAPLAIDPTAAPGMVWLPDAPWASGVTLTLSRTESKKVGRALRE